MSNTFFSEEKFNSNLHAQKYVTFSGPSGLTPSSDSNTLARASETTIVTL